MRSPLKKEINRKGVRGLAGRCHISLRIPPKRPIYFLFLKHTRKSISSFTLVRGYYSTIQVYISHERFATVVDEFSVSLLYILPDYQYTFVTLVARRYPRNQFPLPETISIRFPGITKTRGRASALAFRTHQEVLPIILSSMPICSSYSLYAAA